MSGPLVTFDRVWKRFRRGDVHDSLRDLIPALARRAVRGRSAGESGSDDARFFWALRDVSFRVREGEALGIIGPNGAGKSTVLKLLTRVLGPTRGSCSINGRVGALIEIAAGFHPDLTGKENVYLQGAIMGMSRSEVTRKYDQIVDFAGVEEFLSMPVKRYSSGMNARLGFAIAAHLDPEVLIIDEVLSVGDASFQRKALVRVSELARRGVPVVLVTHQLDQITSLCTRALVLERGRAVAEGAPEECISTYLSSALADDTPVEHAAIAVSSVESQSGRSVPAGRTMILWANMAVHDVRLATLQEIVVRVSSAVTGGVVFEAALHETGVRLPVLSTWYTLELALRLYAPVGAYQLSFIVRDARTGVELGNLGGLYFALAEGASVSGPPTGELDVHVTHAAEYGVMSGYRAGPEQER